MRKFSLFILSIIATTAFAANPSPAYAEVTTTYSGCFERLQENDTTSVVWLNAPICTIRATNNSTADQEYTFAVENLDPAWYLVEDLDGNGIAASRGGTRLTFTINVRAGRTAAVNVSPWDYNPETREFWFAGISDTQTKSGSGRPNNVFISIMDQLEALKPQFTTVSGDIIGGDASDAEDHNEEYSEYFDEYNEHNGSSYLVPGDHDERQDIDEYYSQYFGEDQWTFVYGNTRFVGFHTAENGSSQGTLTEAQFDWLETTLGNATEENIIVLHHHGLTTPEWANGQGINPDQRLRLGQLYIDNGVDLLLIGDVHGYEDKTITSNDIAGLDGSIQQLTIGGAGGNLKNYDDTDHFFILLHINGTTIEHQLFDYSEFDLTLDYEDANDGTESEVNFTIYNNSTYDIPYMRAQVNLDASENVYARSTVTGEFLPMVSAMVDDVFRGYLELYIAADESISVVAKEYRNALTKTKNVISDEGVVSFESLPQASAVETGISLDPANSATINVQKWNTGNNKREWIERGEAKSRSDYTISGLETNRQYNVFMGRKLLSRLQPDETGTASFTYKSKKTRRTYKILEETDRTAQYVGAMPASGGGSNMSIYNGQGRKINSYFPYDNLSGGFDSIWADIDGDDALEVVYAPKDGNKTTLVATERNGSPIASIKPFGKKFDGGAQMVAADVNNNGRQEIVVAADNNYGSDVYVYSYRPNRGAFKKVAQFRVFTDAYNDGLNLTAGNVNGKAGDEVIVAAQNEKDGVFVYKWQTKKKKMKLWKSVQPFDGEASTFGMTVAAGDLDYDGRDELVVGSQTASAAMRVYDFKPKTKRLKKVVKSKNVYASGYEGGVEYVVGNIDKNAREEIIAVPLNASAAEGKVKIYRWKKNGKVKKIAAKKPFGKNAAGIDIALADVRGGWKKEIIAARSRGASDVRVFRKKGKTLKKIKGYAVYSDGFSGGIELTK